MRKGKGSYRTYSIPSKTAVFVPEFAAEDLPLGRTAALVPEFAVKDLPLGRTPYDYDDIQISHYLLIFLRHCRYSKRSRPMSQNMLL